jgi:beta-lactam-binding protein with PASTA domain
MPDVIGKQLSAVQDYFRDVGLRVGGAQGVEYPGITPNTIVKQTPPAGYKVSKDSYIGLYYSK